MNMNVLDLSNMHIMMHTVHLIRADIKTLCSLISGGCILDLHPWDFSASIIHRKALVDSETCQKTRHSPSDTRPENMNRPNRLWNTVNDTCSSSLDRRLDMVDETISCSRSRSSDITPTLRGNTHFRHNGQNAMLFDCLMIVH